MTNGQLPAHLLALGQGDPTEHLRDSLGASAPPYVSIMGNRFALVDGAGEERAVATFDPAIGPYLDCVVLDALERISKIYYANAFDPSAQNYQPPECWSDNGVGPSRQSAVPQSPTCAACPNNAWGSATSRVSGRGVKACSDYQKLALLVPGAGGDIAWLLRVPPNSLKNLRGYTERFRGQAFGVRAVATRISFQAGVLGTLQFQAVQAPFAPNGFVDQPTAETVVKLMGSRVADAIVGRHDQPRDVALPAPGSAPAAALPPSATYQPQPLPAQPAPVYVPPPPVQPPQAVAQAPADGQQPQRRRRRSSAAPPAPAAPGQAAAPVAPFPHPGASATVPPAPSPQSSFGFSPGVAPNPEVAAALEQVFGKPQG